MSHILLDLALGFLAGMIGGWLIQRLFEPRRRTLIVMRSADMTLVHPQTDFSFKCSRCDEAVGIYPSGMDIIRTFGIRHTHILCNHCADAAKIRRAQLAPGALAERGQSVRKGA